MHTLTARPLACRNLVYLVTPSQALPQAPRLYAQPSRSKPRPASPRNRLATVTSLALPPLVHALRSRRRTRRVRALQRPWMLCGTHSPKSCARLAPLSVSWWTTAGPGAELGPGLGPALAGAVYGVPAMAVVLGHGAVGSWPRLGAVKCRVARSQLGKWRLGVGDRDLLRGGRARRLPQGANCTSSSSSSGRMVRLTRKQVCKALGNSQHPGWVGHASRQEAARKELRQRRTCRGRRRLRCTMRCSRVSSTSSSPLPRHGWGARRQGRPPQPLPWASPPRPVQPPPPAHTVPTRSGSSCCCSRPRGPLAIRVAAATVPQVQGTRGGCSRAEATSMAAAVAVAAAWMRWQRRWKCHGLRHPRQRRQSRTAGAGVAGPGGCW